MGPDHKQLSKNWNCKRVVGSTQIHFCIRGSYLEPKTPIRLFLGLHPKLLYQLVGQDQVSPASRYRNQASCSFFPASQGLILHKAVLRNPFRTILHKTKHLKHSRQLWLKLLDSNVQGQQVWKYCFSSCHPMCKLPPPNYLRLWSFLWFRITFCQIFHLVWSIFANTGTQVSHQKFRSWID